MEENLKQLLLVDLCARLPYKVKCPFNCKKGVVAAQITEIDLNQGIISYIPEGSSITYCSLIYSDTFNLKLYLRPIRSLTAEECDRLFKILDINEEGGDWLKINDINVIRLFTESGKDFYEIAEAMDYLYSIHVDFKGMIEKGLALEAKEGMYKTE